MAGKKNKGGATPQQDERFQRVHSDPRFIRPQREEGQVKLDDRFKHLLQPGRKDRKGPKVDRFGRKTHGQSSAEAEHLKRIYRVEEQASSSEEAEDDDDDASDSEPTRPDFARGEALLESSSSEDDSDENDEDESGSESDDSATGEVTLGTRQALRDAHKRAAAASASESDSDSESEPVQPITGAAQPDAEGLDTRAYDALDKQATKQITREKKRKDAVPLGERSRRLAAVNMDWDNLRAVDLYAVFASVVHPLASATTPVMEPAKGKGKGGAALRQSRGRCVRVRIYPSDFGRDRMAQEDRYGPPTDIFRKEEDSKKKGKSTDTDSDEEQATGPAGFQEDEGAEFDENKLRKYQLERLRYYYAIAEFDSEASASAVYDTIDGSEMEASANIFDLRFVPDHMEFPEYAAPAANAPDAAQKSDGFTDQATEADLMGKYTGVDFKTDALRHSRVKLTWDQDDTQRSKVTRRKANDPALAEEDYQAYLASDTSGSDAEGEEEQVAPAAAEPEATTGNKHAERTRSLLLSGLDTSGSKKKGRKDENLDMEITFTPALSGGKPETGAAGAGTVPVTTAPAPTATQESSEEKEETTREKYLRKQREKREARMAKLVERQTNQEAEQQHQPASDEELPGGLAGDDGATEGLGHFSMQDIVRAEKDKNRATKLRGKAKKKAQARAQELEKAEARLQPGFQVNTEDDRFNAMFTDHQFALDPSHSAFRKTDAMKKLLESSDKKRRRQEGEANEKQESNDPAALVQRLKQRAQRPNKKQKQNA